MMLNTPVRFPETALNQSYKSRFALIGSCFSDEIGHRLADSKIDCLINPFGTLFNPISIFNCLDKKHTFSTEKIIQSKDLFFHYDLHSSNYDFSKKNLLEKTNLLKKNSLEYIYTSNVLILTFGTAFVHLLHNQEIIANCHKQNARFFTKKLLDIPEICKGFDDVYPQLNPNTQILLTISPVRHTKEGLPENQLSKSILRVACNLICQRYTNVTYLPSYEKMIDDLRDYRYYKSDLIHPSEQACDLIFEEFCTSIFDKESIKTMDSVQKIKQELNHKSLYPKAESTISFQQKLLQKMQKMQHLVDFSKEIDILLTKIKA